MNNISVVGEEFVPVESDSGVEENLNGTYNSVTSLDILVTKSLIGSLYRCELTLEGLTSWKLTLDHKLNINSKA